MRTVRLFSSHAIVKVELSKNEVERYKALTALHPGKRQASFNEWFNAASTPESRTRRRQVGLYFGLEIPA